MYNKIIWIILKSLGGWNKMLLGTFWQHYIAVALANLIASGTCYAICETSGLNAKLRKQEQRTRELEEEGDILFRQMLLETREEIDRDFMEEIDKKVDEMLKNR